MAAWTLRTSARSGDAVRQFGARVGRAPRGADRGRRPHPRRPAGAGGGQGLFGYALPEEHGGLGVTMSEDVQLAIEFGTRPPAFRSLSGTNNGDRRAGHRQVRHRRSRRRSTCPRLAAGRPDRLVRAAPRPRPAPTPPDCGPPPVATATRWVINGSKRYITNAPLADLFVVFARSDPAERGGRGISSFVVETATPGVTVGPRDKKMGAVRRLDGRGVLRRRPGAGRRADRRGGPRLLEGPHRALPRPAAHRRAVRRDGAAGARRVGGLRGDRQAGRRADRPVPAVQGMLADMHAELLAGRSMVRDVPPATTAARTPRRPFLGQALLHRDGRPRRARHAALQPSMAGHRDVYLREDAVEQLATATPALFRLLNEMARARGRRRRLC